MQRGTDLVLTNSNQIYFMQGLELKIVTCGKVWIISIWIEENNSFLTDTTKTWMDAICRENEFNLNLCREI